ncbi:odorant receptor 131-2-like [Dendrobates tinctorius]|uniref:odorant receptor 131-2-like n=1 Tax=Dendrobates tinctorius TaxID=92724 RepID=UPI003CC94F42
MTLFQEDFFKDHVRSENSTYSVSSWTFVRMAVIPPAVFCFGVFLYLMAVMLKIYVTTPNIWASARYILFAHMLINDTLYLLVGFLLLLATVFAITFLVPVCYVLITLGSSTFRTTLYILMAMALERYISVCFPLRHVELCTGPRYKATAIVIWVVGLVPCAADFISLMTSVRMDFFASYIKCNVDLFEITEMQKSLWSITLILSLALGVLIILYTYVNIMVVALKISSGKSSAFKAARTVLLHAFQLLLYFASWSPPYTEMKHDAHYMRFMHFFALTCLPRFISPVIYGLRDEFLRKCIWKTLGYRRH